MTINWDDYDIYESADMPTDWVEVASIDSGGGYDWCTLRAFWSPAARRYFWASGSGCSCDYWGMSLRSPADFEDGDRDALRRAMREFASEHPWSVSATELVDALDKVARFTAERTNQ